MRIDSRISYEPAALERAQKASVKTSEENRLTRVDAELSSDVQLLGLEAKAVAEPEIRQARVDRLRQAIDSGTYAVSDEQLAQAMLSDVLKR